jgi:hypothetical protein
MIRTHLTVNGLKISESGDYQLRFEIAVIDGQPTLASPVMGGVEFNINVTDGGDELCLSKSILVPIN